MTYSLFLDDIRQPEDTFGYTNNQIYLLGWKIIRNYDDFVRCIEENGVPNTTSFDHDLGDNFYDPDIHGCETYCEEYDNIENKNGFDCAKWLINHCIDNKLELPETILIHSMNPVGKINIHMLLTLYRDKEQNVSE